MSSELPHTGPALLLERVIEHTDAGAVCAARVPARSPFRVPRKDGDVIPALLAIEMGAQAAAALEARLRAGEGGAPRPGMVVGVREAELLAAEARADVAFEVAIERSDSAPPLWSFAFELRANGSTFARGVLSLVVDSG